MGAVSGRRRGRSGGASPGRACLGPLLAAAVALVVAAAANGSSAAIPGVPSIYVDYNPDCTFTMSADGGISVTSASAPGPTLPPGNYQVLISMPNPNGGYSCVTPSFTLAGPGVNVQSSFPGQQFNADQLITLQPSSTYVAEDASAPAATEKVFTTAASGSSSSLLPATTTTTPAAGSAQPDLVGSSIVPSRGALEAVVTAAGKATLTFDGRAAGSLKEGKYELTVADASRRAGFFVERSGRKPVTVTGVAFVGRRKEEITLSAGMWSFFSKAGTPTRFAVVA